MVYTYTFKYEKDRAIKSNTGTHRAYNSAHYVFTPSNADYVPKGGVLTSQSAAQGSAKGPEGCTNRDLCQYRHYYGREDGTRCNGGTHHIGDEVDKHFEKKESEKVCRQGFLYQRDDGSRCLGGTHYVDVTDEKKFASKPAKHSCQHGFVYNRQQGTRCYGGTHLVGEGESDSTTFKKEEKKNCMHGFVYNREDGTRCYGGTHHVDDVQVVRSLNPPASRCEQKFAFSREEGQRCKGGSHLRGDDVKPVYTGKGSLAAKKREWQHGPSACPDGYAFSREEGTRCTGGTHFRRHFPSK